MIVAVAILQKGSEARNFMVKIIKWLTQDSFFFCYFWILIKRIAKMSDVGKTGLISNDF